MELTYKIRDKGHAITCTVCGLTSWNKKDVEHLFCSMCNRFHDVPDPVALHVDQYRLLQALRDNMGPPHGLTENPHRMMLALLQRGSLVTEGGIICVSERGRRALEAYATEA